MPGSSGRRMTALIGATRPFKLAKSSTSDTHDFYEKLTRPRRRGQLAKDSSLAAKFQSPRGLNLPLSPIRRIMPADKRPTCLVISQVYPPDPAAVGQHMYDAAVMLAERGFRVVVYTASRGYDDASIKYPSRENLQGVDVRRLPFSSFGKKSIKVRLMAQGLFLLQVMFYGLFVGRMDRIVVSTSPPMAAIAAIFIRFFRRVPITFWAMDINPDQIVAMGQAEEGSLPVKIFEMINRAILKRARGVVALDPYMAERLERKEPVGDRMAIIPPWSHNSDSDPVDHAENPFRKEHGLENKFVIMYSGNISEAHPITTILEAAKRLQDVPEIVFLFIGGGNGKKQIEKFIDEEGTTNIKTLHFQPMDMIRYSLSAADIHLVAMGEEMVGIVHPCKVYGAMAVARPILLLGPRESHVGVILDKHDIGWQVDHGDVDQAEKLLRQLPETDPAELTRRGSLARQIIVDQLGLESPCKRFCDVVEWN